MNFMEGLTNPNWLVFAALFLGVLLFAILNIGLTLLAISSYWYNITIGVVITTAIIISAYRQLRQSRTRVNVKIEG